MSNEVEAIQIDMEKAKSLVSKGEALDRLANHPDFITVISDGYFKDEAVRLVGLKASAQMAAPDKQNDIIKCIDSIGSLQQYLNATWQQAGMAQGAIDDAQEQLNEIALEEGVA